MTPQEQTATATLSPSQQAKLLKKAQAQPAQAPAKMTPLEFTQKAIVALRKDPYKGIHTVFTGFNAAFKEYFGEGADPVATTKQLVAEGKLQSHFAKGGVQIYLPGEMPTAKASGAEKALAAILK